MSDYGFVGVRGYRYRTLTSYVEGDPIPVEMSYNIVRLRDFPQEYIHGKLSSYYDTFADYEDADYSQEFRQRDGMEIVYDLDNEKFCEIDLSIINQDTLVAYDAQIQINPTVVELIQTE